MRRVCVRSYIAPTERKSPPVTTPWLTIWRMPPSMPCVLSENMPSVTNPIWLTELYAIRRFKSVCARQTIAP